MAVLAEIDQQVYELFGLTNAEITHTEERLASFPLDKFKPRYPWQIVKGRSIQSYTRDRFS